MDGAIRLEHCRSATFLMSVQNASLTGVLSSDNCSGAAGILVSQGPVTLRLSAKLIGFFQVCSLQVLDAEEFVVQSHVLCWHLVNTKEMPSSTRPVRRKSGLSDSNFLTASFANEGNGCAVGALQLYNILIHTSKAKIVPRSDVQGTSSSSAQLDGRRHRSLDIQHCNCNLVK